MAVAGLFSSPMESQGFIVGNLDSMNEMSGDNIAYIYPKAKKGLLGGFQRAAMKSARFVNIEEVQCHQNQLEIIKYSKPLSIQFNWKRNGSFIQFHCFSDDRVYGMDMATNVSLGKLSMVPDPYEDWTIEIRRSSIENGGEGAFAKRDLESGEAVSFHNSLRYM